MSLPFASRFKACWRVVKRRKEFVAFFHLSFLVITECIAASRQCSLCSSSTVERQVDALGLVSLYSLNIRLLIYAVTTTLSEHRALRGFDDSNWASATGMYNSYWVRGFYQCTAQHGQEAVSLSVNLHPSSTNLYLAAAAAADQLKTAERPRRVFAATSKSLPSRSDPFDPIQPKTIS